MKKVLTLVLSLIMLFSVFETCMTSFAANSADLPEVLKHPEGKCIRVSTTSEYLTDEKSLTAEDIPGIDVAEIYPVYAGLEVEKDAYLVYINDSSDEALSAAADYLTSLPFVLSAAVDEPSWDISPTDTSVKEETIKKYKDDSNWVGEGVESGFNVTTGSSLYFCLTGGYLTYYGIPTEELISALFPEIEFESIEIYNSGLYVFATIKDADKESVIEACDYLNSFDFIFYASPNVTVIFGDLDPPFITGAQSEYYTAEVVSEIINNYKNDDKWYAEGKSGYVADEGIKVLLTEEFAKTVNVNSPWKEIFDGFEFEEINVSIDTRIYDGYYLIAYPKNADKETVIKACDYLNSLDFVLLAEPEYYVSDDPVVDDPAEKPAPDPAPEKPSESDPTGDPLVEISVIALACAVMITLLVTYNCKKQKTN